jgi:phosphoribosyl-ATP pyrophosphohydrolase
LTNTKGHLKSLERSEAWLLHPLTGRLTAAQWVHGFRSIAEEDRPGEPVRITAESVDQAAMETEYRSSPDAEAPAAGSSGDSGFEWVGEFLSGLENLIIQRKAEMPEGSYTTHLFTKGEDKIRKKAGEEAVELILARDDDELASETADLLYHIMVLYVERGLSLSRAFEVLRERH